jgi:hypothetical protein
MNDWLGLVWDVRVKVGSMEKRMFRVSVRVE